MNKDIATGFLKTVVSRKIRDAYEKYIAPEFIHHNQWFQGDRQTLMLAMEDAHEKFPEMTMNIKHIVEEGDLVITHSHVRHTPDSIGMVAVHIFKMKDQKIIEMWDVVMPSEDNSPNENTAF